MVTLNNLIYTFRVTKNPFEIILARFTKERKKISFANGAQFMVTWSQFCFLRDNYALMVKYQLEQINNESFRIYANQFQIVGTQVLIRIWDEIQSGIYDYDYKNKTVLDVGGFEGESAVYFWKKGAKKVIIYEPVLEHRKFIEENVSLNKINAEIHCEGIGNGDGEITVAYNRIDNCFGLETGELANERTIKVKDITKAIIESKADVAKIDCEGAEISIASVPREILRTLEYLIIEMHSRDIRKALIKKFQESGFEFKGSNKEETQQISLCYFKRV